MTASATRVAAVTVAPAEASLVRHFHFSGRRCHASPAFLRAHEPDLPLVWFRQESGDTLEASAVAHLRRGRLFGKLTFPTPPIVAGDAAPLWDAIRGYCRAQRVGTVSVHSFEGPERLIPPLGGPRLTERVEYVVDLSPPPDRLLAACSENHRRNVRKAQKQNLTVRVATDAAAADDHAALFQQSMDRRAARGEDVPAGGDAARVRRLLAAGAGRLVRVERDGQALTSLCILSTPERAYYHSGGSAPDGMKLGSSHLAMWSAMERCRDEGVRWFCLGGASERDGPGLTAFKQGFGPVAVPLAHAVYEMDLGFPWSVARRLLGR